MKATGLYMRLNYFLLSIPLFFLAACGTQGELGPLQPTDGAIVKEGTEEGGKKKEREAFFEMIHKSAAEDNWKAIESQNTKASYQRKQSLRQKSQLRGDEETLIEGHLKGTWIERGSNNQAGSVFRTEYDPETDMIYLVSAGGSIFKGKRDGSQWDVVNQDLRFDPRFLIMTENPSGSNRLLASVSGRPHYSDDEGLTWEAAIGFMPSANGGRADFALQVADGTIYFLGRYDWWSDYALYRSLDRGESYEMIHPFLTGDLRDLSMCSPHYSDDLLIMEQLGTDQARLLKWNIETEQMDIFNTDIGFGFGSNGRANLVGSRQNDLEVLYSYNHENKVYRSEDYGLTWAEISTLPTRPWEVGLFLSKSDPTQLLYGEVEAYRSSDSGENWRRINAWSEYYSGVENKLHADMMYFNEFKNENGLHFIAISNHGGLSVSYDYGFSNKNISLEGLNVGQFYDVKSDINYDTYIFGGTQDQGFQRGEIFPGDTEIALEQTQSGDYGHIEITNYGLSLWTVYPGGLVFYFHDPYTNGSSDYFEVVSQDESVWIPPLMAHPDRSKNTVYLAGGSEAGGPGSFIIELEKDGFIKAKNLPHNFISNGQVSAMAISPLDTNFWFVMTTDGSFFRSKDAGQSFHYQQGALPQPHYLYGSCIIPSAKDQNIVYISGSGYSNPPVYKSVDGGKSFKAMSDGLPSTLVFALAPTSDEKIIFAATEAGPYAYVQEENKWYDISGLSAPNQSYWSVQYLPHSKTVRYGTYGRGIWDLQLKGTSSLEEELEEKTLDVNVYPNPTSTYVNIAIDDIAIVRVEVIDINGRQVLSKEADLRRVDISTLESGVYGMIMYTADNQRIVRQVIKQ